MALSDLFKRRRTHAPSGGSPGDTSAPQDTRGDGVVTLADRTAPGSQGSPDTNQAKTEPMPPTPGHSDPDEAPGPATDPPGVPELGDMNAGAANAFIASPAGVDLPVRTDPALGADVPSGPVSAGVAPAEDRPRVDASSTGGGAGPERPAQRTSGTAQRAPGSLGQQGAGETVDTDVQVGAARMQPGRPPASSPPPEEFPGDSQGVNVPHAQPAPGTSEEAGIVHGIKTPGRTQE